MSKVALAIIATNNYIDFVPPLLESADKYFLHGHEVTYHVFTNFNPPPIWDGTYRREIDLHFVEHQPWPAMTLRRYHIMTSADLSGYDYVFYIDADMLFVSPVGDEILGELVGVIHPGFYRGGGSWETRNVSIAYVAPSLRIRYICGGFQGGAKYLQVAKTLANRVDMDARLGITAVYADESHWNCLFAYDKTPFKILDPSYCMVEEPEKRKAWGIDHFQPKIIALAKDHSKYQK